MLDFLGVLLTAIVGALSSIVTLIVTSHSEERRRKQDVEMKKLDHQKWQSEFILPQKFLVIRELYGVVAELYVSIAVLVHTFDTEPENAETPTPKEVMFQKNLGKTEVLQDDLWSKLRQAAIYLDGSSYQIIVDFAEQYSVAVLAIEVAKLGNILEPQDARQHVNLEELVPFARAATDVLRRILNPSHLLDFQMGPYPDIKI